MENSIATYEPHACIVVYSVVSKGSLLVAEEILNYLWQENYTREYTVIVVGNKADLMRARCITTEGAKQIYLNSLRISGNARQTLYTVVLHFILQYNILSVIIICELDFRSYPNNTNTRPRTYA